MTAKTATTKFVRKIVKRYSGGEGGVLYIPIKTYQRWKAAGFTHVTVEERDNSLVFTPF